MRCIKSLVIIFSLFTLTAHAQEGSSEKFPRTGYAKNDGAAVRAGDNVNFETLCALSKSEPVKIVDKRYSWFKILLPRKASLYVSKDYVTLTSDEKGIGVINAVHVNLRAGAGTRYSIVGQISKPEKVSILSEIAGWYKIEPPYGAAGWIHSGQIDIREENDSNNPETKEAAKETKEKNVKPSSVRLNAGYPAPKGNLSISTTTSTKNNR